MYIYRRKSCHCYNCTATAAQHSFFAIEVYTVLDTTILVAFYSLQQQKKTFYLRKEINFKLKEKLRENCMEHAYKHCFRDIQIADGLDWNSCACLCVFSLRFRPIVLF